MAQCLHNYTATPFFSTHVSCNNLPLGIMSSMNSDDGLKSTKIELRCFSYMLEKYVSLKEVFNGCKYYIQVRECDENHRTKGGQFLLDLCKDHNDAYHNL